MPRELKTDWKRIGRSGPTVDGRTIDPNALNQAAKNYDKSLFAAIINYEHSTFANLGSVEKLRAESNSEGGVDLFAILAPNDLYLSLNKDGQKVHTSMELDFDFRETGEAYLTGLAATDRPASAATTQMAFSRDKKSELLVSGYSETPTKQFNDDTDDEQAPSWFTKLFNKSAEADMDKKQLETLKTEFATLKTQITEFMAGKKPEASEKDDKPNDKKEFATAEQVADLTQKLTALEAKLSGEGEEKTEADVKLAALQTALDDLSAKFSKAVGEQPSTDAGPHDDGGEDLSKYV